MIPKYNPDTVGYEYRFSVDRAGDGVIVQSEPGIGHQVLQRVIDTREAAIAAKLTEIGWTSPEETKLLRATIERQAAMIRTIDPLYR